MLQVNAIDHINMYVKNLDETVHFYEKVFGLKEYESGLGSSGAPYKIIGLSDSLFLCLYEDKNLGNVKETINHFGFHVDDIDKKVELLKSNNIDVLYGGVVDYGKSKSVYIKDPSGYEIEISSKFGGGF